MPVPSAAALAMAGLSDLPFDVYSNQLFKCGQGLPLWLPEPSKHGEALIGDVGYIDKGRFFRLFNVTCPSDDKVHNRLGVPEDFKPFPIVDHRKHRDEDALQPGAAICSKSVRAQKVGAHLTVSV